jgi:hypothetical protein
MRKQGSLQRTLASVSLILLLGCAVVLPAQAAKLSDLVKRPSELYLPTQLIPGKTANFTLKAKAGQSYMLIISSESKGTTLPNGMALRVGKPTVQEKGVIPASGVLSIPVQVPDDIDKLGTEQFVEAVVWTEPAQEDGKAAIIIEHTGNMSDKNTVLVGAEPDGGHFMIMPGDSGMSSLFRSLDTMSNVGGDPRKKELLYNGEINRQRQLDQNLNSFPTP